MCVLILISFSRMAYKSHDGFRAEVRDAAGVVKVISPHWSQLGLKRKFLIVAFFAKITVAFLQKLLSKMT